MDTTRRESPPSPPSSPPLQSLSHHANEDAHPYPGLPFASNRIYIELASQYTLMDSSSNIAKRNVLAEHLKEVIDTLEQKGDQIASLYSLLAFEDRPLGGAGERERERKAFRSVKDLLRSVQKEEERQEKPRRREGVV